MSSAFLSAVQALREGVTALGAEGSPIESISLEDGSSIILKVKPSGTRARGAKLSVGILDVDAYPASGAMIWCEDEDEKLQDAINSLNERVQDRAPLMAVVQKV